MVISIIALFVALSGTGIAATNALAADGMLPAGIDQSRIVVEPPRESAHGDMATNAAMVLAKDAGRPQGWIIRGFHVQIDAVDTPFVPNVASSAPSAA